MVVSQLMSEVACPHTHTHSGRGVLSRDEVMCVTLCSSLNSLGKATARIS